MTQEDNTDINEYQVISIEKTTPPDGASDDNWHRYVIGKGKSRIEGKKSGSLFEVTQHAETFVEDLNSRRAKYGAMYVYGRQR